MSNGDFLIIHKTLVKYRGKGGFVTIPEGVEKIGAFAFNRCYTVKSVTCPEGLKKIGRKAFRYCREMTMVEMENGLTEIGKKAFLFCGKLYMVLMPDSVTRIGKEAFSGCHGMKFLFLSQNLRKIPNGAFSACHGLEKVTLPEELEYIGPNAFSFCSGIEAMEIPEKVKTIGMKAFLFARSLRSLQIKGAKTKIGEMAFWGVNDLKAICREGSCAHGYFEKHHLFYLFDYQAEILKNKDVSQLERFAAPFPADEQEPYIFISYSHRNSREIFSLITKLYNAGWHIWFDEGLTIGDSYDAVLEEHVKNCAAFLWFVTKDSVKSVYVAQNEIPWAMRYGKPIIKCLLEEGCDCALDYENCVTAADRESTEQALSAVAGAAKGEPRRAKGTYVFVDPRARGFAEAENYTYCLYAGANGNKAKSILLEAKNNGCRIYDAVVNGEDADREKNSACLTFFLDGAFLADRLLRAALAEAYKNRKDDMVICLLEETELPAELAGLEKTQWLKYNLKNERDLDVKLAAYLTEKGCRSRRSLPGFRYKKTRKGIVLTAYFGNEENIEIEAAYGDIPVIGIGKKAFANNKKIKTVILPDSVTEIDDEAFRGCESLTAIDVPDSVTRIGYRAFRECKALVSASLGSGLQTIGDEAFIGCEKLRAISIPDSVTKLGRAAFRGCLEMRSAVIGSGVKRIESSVFCFCEKLSAVKIKEGVQEIGYGVFYRCAALSDVEIPAGVTKIDKDAFLYAGWQAPGGKDAPEAGTGGQQAIGTSGRQSRRQMCERRGRSIVLLNKQIDTFAV